MGFKLGHGGQVAGGGQHGHRQMHIGDGIAGGDVQNLDVIDPPIICTVACVPEGDVDILTGVGAEVDHDRGRGPCILRRIGRLGNFNKVGDRIGGS
jgi:hypothetical protein